MFPLLSSLQQGYVPPAVVSAELYEAVKGQKTAFPEELVGFIGYSCSYGGKFFGGYAKASNRNYADEQARNLQLRAPKLAGVRFLSCSYDELTIPPCSIIYCDPPYKGTTQYRFSFDHDRFWDWAKRMANSGHTVFVSEYSAPGCVECVLSIEHKTCVDKKAGSRLERLYRVRND